MRALSGRSRGVNLRSCAYLSFSIGLATFLKTVAVILTVAGVKYVVLFCPVPASLMPFTRLAVIRATSDFERSLSNQLFAGLRGSLVCRRDTTR